jgi:uncharacterized protein YndB with AHSA1/START domain
MTTVTTHTRRAERSTSSSPSAVFAAAADLTRFPRWWFSRELPEVEGQPPAPNPVHHVDEVDGGGTIAAPGVAVDVRTDPLEGELLGRAVTVERAMTRRVTCEAVDPGSRLVLAHRVTAGAVAEGSSTAYVLRTTVTIEPEGAGARIVLSQDTEVHGRGLRVVVVRKAHDNADGIAGETLERLLELVEPGA